MAGGDALASSAAAVISGGGGGVPYVDVTIRRGDDLESDCRRVLEAVRPSWRADELLCTRFDAGITNTLVGFRRTCDADRSDVVLLRVYGDHTDIVIDRAAEKRNMVALHAAGCAPPLYACFGNGLAYGYVSGSPVDRERVREPRVARLIGAELAKMHSIPLGAVLGDDGGGSPAPSELPPLFAKMRAFLDHYPSRFEGSALDWDKFAAGAIPPRDALAAELALLEREVGRGCAGDCGELVFCHNDLLLNNIIYDEDDGGAVRVGFIDYEYGGPNPAAYDIGNHFCEYAGVDDTDFARYPGRAYQLDWIRHYLLCRRRRRFLAAASSDGGDDFRLPAAAAAAGDEVDEASVQRLYSAANKYALCSHMFWGLWGLIQAQHSRIDFDYLTYGELRFAEYFARKSEFLALS